MNCIPELLVIASISGCASTGASTIQSQPPLSAAELLQTVPNLECGGVQGLVRSSRQPYEQLDGVLVRFRNSPVATLTDGGGLFVLSPAAVRMVDQSDFVLEVARVGYATQQILLDPKSERATVVQVYLERSPLRHDHDPSAAPDIRVGAKYVVDHIQVCEEPEGHPEHETISVPEPKADAADEQIRQVGRIWRDLSSVQV